MKFNIGQSLNIKLFCKSHVFHLDMVGHNNPMIWRYLTFFIFPSGQCLVKIQMDSDVPALDRIDVQHWDQRSMDMDAAKPWIYTVRALICTVHSTELAGT